MIYQRHLSGRFIMSQDQFLHLFSLWIHYATDSCIFSWLSLRRAVTPLREWGANAGPPLPPNNTQPQWDIGLGPGQWHPIIRLHRGLAGNTILNTVVKKACRLKPLSWHCGCNPSVDFADQSRVNYCWSLENVNLECWPRGESVLAQREAKGLMSGKECVFASFRLSEPHLMTLIVNENSNLWRSLSYLPYETSLISSHTASTSFCGYFKGDGLEVLADLQTHRRSISKQR